MPLRPSELTAAYEAIRAQANGGLPTTSPRGLTLLLTAGLPTWIRAWGRLAPVRASIPPAADSPRSGAEVVRILTQMALSCQARWAT